MKKELQEAYNNFKFLSDEHKCSAKDRDTLNLNLLNFQNHINTLVDDVLEEAKEEPELAPSE